jgi:hypothetical protein
MTADPIPKDRLIELGAYRLIPGAEPGAAIAVAPLYPYPYSRSGATFVTRLQGRYLMLELERLGGGHGPE